jgi:hypothetical protein
MYICTVCSKSFNQKNQLAGHSKIHGRRYLVNKEVIFKSNSELNKKRALEKYNLKPRYCKHCNTRFSYEEYKSNRQKWYCNRSCAASFNNKGRARTDISKKQTSQKLVDHYNAAIQETNCRECNKIIQVKRKQISLGNYCSVCIKVRNNKIIKRYNCVQCGKDILKNKFNMCKDCWIVSDEFEKQRGNYRKNFIKGYYFCKEDKKDVYLNSSLEFSFAKFCDDNNIKWSKPGYLKYTVNDKQHYYFPDFYLNEHDLYVEVKGYFWKSDKEKMDAVLTCNCDKKIIIIQQKELYQLISGEKKLISL